MRAGVYLLAMTLAVAAGFSAWGERMNQQATDFFFSLRGPRVPDSPAVAIVAIDDDSVRRYGWPLDRALLARALEQICAAQPSVVAIDLLFSDPTNPDSDRSLARALRGCPKTVLAARLSGEDVASLEAAEWAEPLPEFSGHAAAIAHAHADLDPDGVSRRILLAKTAAGKRRWALALETLRVELGYRRPILEDESSLIVNGHSIPAPRDRAAAGAAGAAEGARSQRLLIINYAGGEGAYQRISLHHVLEQQGAALLAGRPVLVGVTAQAGVTDRKFTPLSTAGRDMPGVEIHANIFDMMRSGRFLVPLSPLQLVLCIALTVALVAGSLLLLRGRWLVLALAALAIAVHVAPYVAFTRQAVLAPPFSIWLAFWSPLVLGGILQYATVWRHFVAADAGRQRLRGRLEMVSHEMRTPLTAIQGSSELMGRHILDDDRRVQLAGLIQRESARLSSMVERFLDVERLETGDIALRREPVPLAPLVDRTLERLQPVVRRKNIELKKTVAGEPSAIGDSELLEFALYNLVNNAVKYSPDGTTVEVSVRTSDHPRMAYLDVSDQGAGIAPEDQARIFDRFFRSESARQSGQPGLGLGLSIVREIARHHGGSVLLDSKPGRGSKFSLALPMANPS